MEKLEQIITTYQQIIQETEIEVECQGEIFKAKGKIVLQDGWKLFRKRSYQPLCFTRVRSVLLFHRLKTMLLRYHLMYFCGAFREITFPPFRRVCSFLNISPFTGLIHTILYVFRS